ncbi:type 1 fimbrial protein [Pseudomonas brenneri]|uniref:type 1 fimbrial protein n=1 Tax=Pseudomonas brenneri TaxID=129817 RepID=UPI003570D3C7
MSSQRLAVGISLFLALVSGSGQAATTAAQGVIQFRGSIVEATCNAGGGAGSTLALSGCPMFAPGGNIGAYGVEPIRTVSAPDHSAVKVTLVAETTGDGRYFDRQYRLNDAAGKPLQSGAYLVTLSYP